MSFFSSVIELPPNSILGVAQECKKDPFPLKIDLTIGAYRDEKGLPQVLNCVREAEDIIHNQKLDHEYLSQVLFRRRSSFFLSFIPFKTYSRTGFQNFFAQVKFFYLEKMQAYCGMIDFILFKD